MTASKSWAHFDSATVSISELRVPDGSVISFAPGSVVSISTLFVTGGTLETFGSGTLWSNVDVNDLTWTSGYVHCFVFRSNTENRHRFYLAL